MTVSSERNTIRLLVDSVLAAHDGRCLGEQAERDLLAAMLVDVLTEYLGPVEEDMFDTK